MKVYVYSEGTGAFWNLSKTNPSSSAEDICEELALKSEYIVPEDWEDGSDIHDVFTFGKDEIVDGKRVLTWTDDREQTDTVIIGVKTEREAQKILEKVVESDPEDEAVELEEDMYILNYTHLFDHRGFTLTTKQMKSIVQESLDEVFPGSTVFQIGSFGKDSFFAYFKSKFEKISWRAIRKKVTALELLIKDKMKEDYAYDMRSQDIMISTETPSLRAVEDRIRRGNEKFPARFSQLKVSYLTKAIAQLDDPLYPALYINLYNWNEPFQFIIYQADFGGMRYGAPVEEFVQVEGEDAHHALQRAIDWATERAEEVMLSTAVKRFEEIYPDLETVEMHKKWYRELSPKKF